jgi:hypothetical protein
VGVEANQFTLQSKQALKHIDGFSVYVRLFKRHSLDSKLTKLKQELAPKLELILAVQSQMNSFIFEAEHPELYEQLKQSSSETFELVESGKRCKVHLDTFVAKLPSELIALDALRNELVAKESTLVASFVVPRLGGLVIALFEEFITADEAVDKAIEILASFTGTVGEELAIAEAHSELEVLRLYRKLDSSDTE